MLAAPSATVEEKMTAREKHITSILGKLDQLKAQIPEATVLVEEIQREFEFFDAGFVDVAVHLRGEMKKAQEISRLNDGILPWRLDTLNDYNSTNEKTTLSQN